MYYVRLCSKKLLSDIARARTLFVLLPRSCCLSFAVLLLRHPPSSSSRNSTRVTLHLASVSRVVGSYSRRFERTRNDTVSPLSLPFFRSILSRPPSFYSIPLQERKRMIEMPRVDRPSSLMALLFFDLRVKKICMRILLEWITSDSFFGYLPLLNNKLQMKDKRDILS